MPVKKTAAKKEEAAPKARTAVKGDKVKVDYTGTLDDGQMFDSSTHGDHSHPLEFVLGSGEVIKGFDEAIIGMKIGEEKNVILPKEQAYGDHNPTLLKKVPKSNLPPDKELKAGMMLVLKTPDGHQIPAKIAEVNASEAVIDLNHPLAGKTLHFKLKLVDIEETK
jgi:FKBP-type peptidyl-prolyl cis-trans isomerase 2